ncbi:hypothetical protein [Actinomadura rugatobispora]|uniref:Uncharacterized protein n=1 Tax=Actinomadura rugatobispora TaxID=1994 RepID=A0ABW1A5K6_9ACTN|nr:hypothetical protein GCM10010200_048000 [Actinomadura rugatobispora]
MNSVHADAFVDAAVASIPAGRMARPEEVTVDGGLVSNGLYHHIITESGGLSDGT